MNRFRPFVRISCFLIAVSATLLPLDAVATDRQEVRTMDRALVGWLVERADGVIEARDSSRRLIGLYRPSSNTTYTASLRPVAYGNVLSAMLLGCFR